jgi:hypothetical protein
MHQRGFVAIQVQLIWEIGLAQSLHLPLLMRLPVASAKASLQLLASGEVPYRACLHWVHRQARCNTLQEEAGTTEMVMWTCALQRTRPATKPLPGGPGGQLV